MANWAYTDELQIDAKGREFGRVAKNRQGKYLATNYQTGMFMGEFRHMDDATDAISGYCWPTFEELNNS